MERWCAFAHAQTISIKFNSQWNLGKNKRWQPGCFSTVSDNHDFWLLKSGSFDRTWYKQHVTERSSFSVCSLQLTTTTSVLSKKIQIGPFLSLKWRIYKYVRVCAVRFWFLTILIQRDSFHTQTFFWFSYLKKIKSKSNLIIWHEKKFSTKL